MLITHSKKVGNAYPTFRKSVRVLTLTIHYLIHRDVLQQTDKD